MSKIKIELNHDGIRQLLKSAEMETSIKEHASLIAARAGAGYTSDSKQMDSRVIASAYTEDFEAMKDNAENNTLLKVLKG